MDSLYGGRPGAPFVIRGTFKSIEEMQEAFKKGPDYKDVWYGEYCLIDTPNKNHFDNGKIFQRGTEYANADGDPKYVGQIVGPQSGVPMFDMDSLDEVKKYAKGHDANGKPFADKEQGEPGYETRTWPFQNGDVVDLYQDRAENDHTSDKDIATKKFSPTKNMVAGATRNAAYRINDGSFQDDIEYTWVNVAYPYGTSEDEDSGEELFASAKTLLGFKMPYPVEGFALSSKLPYNETTGSYEDPTKIYEEDYTVKHPYAYQWNLTLPAGIKGDSIRNLRVLTQEAAENARKNGGYKQQVIFRPTDIKVSSKKDGNNRYKYTDDTTASTFDQYKPVSWAYPEAQFWFCDVYLHSDKRDGEKYLVYLGEADEITKIELEDNFPTTKSDGKTLAVTTTNKRRLEKGTLNEVLDFYSDLGAGRSNHLYALFSAKSERKNDVSAVGYAKGFQSVRYSNKDTKSLNWRDLGVIKDESGLLVGHDVTSDTAVPASSKKTRQALLDWLNANRPLVCHFDANGVFTGYTDPSGQGLEDAKLVTYHTGGSTWFYAWDYSYLPSKAKGDTEGKKLYKWYLMGVWSASVIVSENGSKPDSAQPGDWYLPITTNQVYNDRELNWWEYPVSG